MSFFISCAQAEVTVTLDSGRSLWGEVDSRSDEEQLWLRRTEGNVILTTAIRWDSIGSASVGENIVDSEELVRVLRAQATEEPEAFLTEFETLQGSIHFEKPVMALSSRVVSIEADAVLSNLDRTVEADGLVLALSAVDDTGRFVPVRGSLTARLIVERNDFHSGQVTFEEFGRWTAPVSMPDFLEGVAEFTLRFRRLSPEFDWQLCTAALVNIRLSIYGEGNFEASVPVAIHQFNPIRDELRNQQGFRFFRNELTHGPRQGGPRNLHRGYSAPNLEGF